MQNMLLIRLFGYCFACILLLNCCSVNHGSRGNDFNKPVSPVTKDSNIVHVADSTACDQSLWQHVYRPERLQVVESCKTVTGKIEKIRPEKDGDLHILLKLDEGQEHLLNKRNYQQQKGNLVLEPICVGEITQSNAIEPCEGYKNIVEIPGIGDHVKVTGSYVLDTDHMWMEIHPVMKIEVTE